MRLSGKQIEDLQTILRELTGDEYSSEETQAAGLAILRFVYAKKLSNKRTINEEKVNEKE